ncbi:MAG: phage major capsid protein [Mycobacterium sp.]|nr:phage major capsid protein [Mycobacterium sp.]
MAGRQHEPAAWADRRRGDDADDKDPAQLPSANSVTNTAVVVVIQRDGQHTGEDLTGVLTIAGTTAVPFATDVPTTLRKAITALQVKGETPNAWVLNPADAEAIDLAKEGTGGIGYLNQGGYTNGLAGTNNVFGEGITRVVSNSVPAGTAVLADWTKVRLEVREDVRLDIDTSGDNFAINAATFRAETRVGVAHLRPSAFAIVDLTA